MPTTTPPSGSPVEVPADDGVGLSGTWFAPQQPMRGAALIVAAMGVPARFYAAHAAWLSRQGVGTLTFDFRGYASSRRGKLRAVEADASRWAADARDALRYVVSRAEGTPITWIGHSFGGQVVPFADHEKLARVITVATGSGHWRLHPQPHLRAALWTIVAPALCRAVGYFPGKRLGIVGDLPRNVMLEWSHWCRDRDYLVGALGAHEAFDQMTTPITQISFTDDELIPPHAIDDLHRWYSSSDITQLRFAPGDAGLERLGHTGYFRSAAESLWNDDVLPHVPRIDQPTLP